MIFEPILPWWILAAVDVVLIIGLVILAIKKSPRLRQRRWWLRIAILVLLCIMMWRPQIFIGATQERSTLMDVYFVIDTTQSMVAEDYNGPNPRLQGVEKDADAIMRQLSGARFSVLTFDNRARVALALTTDSSAVLSAVASSRTVMYTYAAGSSIGEPVTLLKEALRKGRNARPDRSAVVFYFGDGEQTSKQPIGSFADIKEYIKGGAVLGYGTSEGGRMIKTTYTWNTGEKEYVERYEDYKRVDALSKYNESNLKKIANEMGIAYFHRTAPDDGKTITGSLKATDMVPGEQDKRINTRYDFYWVPALFAFILLIADYQAALGQVRKTKINKGGSK